MTIQKSRQVKKRLGRNILALSGVSFLADVSGEMSYSLLPIFLSSVLHVNAKFIGVIEGFAEAIASFLKLISGWWSDKAKNRKPLVIWGYSIAFSMRPLMAMAQSAGQVLSIRVIDRIGKGIRTSPRDALIAESVDSHNRGRAYGFHRAADNAGAVLGPLIAFMLLYHFGTSLRTVFWWAVVPAVGALLLLAFGVREEKKPHAVTAGPEPVPEMVWHDGLSRRFWGCIIMFFIFTLGSSTDAFLILRANQLGISAPAIPLLWAAFNGVKVLFGTYSGALSDRIGRRPVIIAGWTWYAIVYFGFAFATETWHAWTLFALYGLFYSLTEGVEKALIVDIVPARHKGAALGWYHMAVGLASLPASLIFGMVWDKYGSPAAFVMDAVLALIASVGFIIVAPRQRTAS